MVSIIVSSYKEDLFYKFSESVKQTIGNIEYEIIKVHNPGLMGICEAYNLGGKQAKYDFLVFSHEDILFHTYNWGGILIEIFSKDREIGLIGIAGGLYKTFFYSGWAISSISSSMFMIASHYGKSNLNKVKNGTSSTYALSSSKQIPNTILEADIYNEKVAMLDGMFLATKKSVFNEIAFDQQTFRGFHCYDLDYSLQVGRKHKVVVNHNILLEHLSPGNFDRGWIKDIKKFYKKWIGFNVSVKHFNSRIKSHLEFLAYEQYLRVCKQNKLNFFYSLAPLYTTTIIRGVGIFNWMILNLRILRKGVLLTFKLLKF